MKVQIVEYKPKTTQKRGRKPGQKDTQPRTRRTVAEVEAERAAKTPKAPKVEVDDEFDDAPDQGGPVLKVLQSWLDIVQPFDTTVWSFRVPEGYARKAQALPDLVQGDYALQNSATRAVLWCPDPADRARVEAQLGVTLQRIEP
ncbi:hypothetical protein [Azospirillum sp. sgz301742]